MCGRTVTHASIDSLESEFAAKFNYEFQPIYNGAPTLMLPVISNDQPGLIQAFRFGFIAPWNPKIPVFNTVSETALEKKMFSEPLKNQRCLVLATGFYEWSPLDDSAKPKKQPYFIYLNDQPIFAMAGIWTTHLDKSTGEETKCFSIFTTTPNKLMDKIKHHRCPVILKKEDRMKWLDNVPLESIVELSRYQYPAEKMNAHPVGKLVGNEKELIEPIGEKLYK